MSITPLVSVARFAHLQAGDLFICPNKESTFVALKAVAPDGDNLMVPIGPRFPNGLAYPSLIAEPAITVISLGKEYALRLPARPEGWCLAAPAPEIHCIAMTEQGAFLRASFVPPAEGYKPCYIALDTGTILTAGSGWSEPYITPRAPVAFAVEWELLTREPEPRRILAFPW